MFVNNSNAESGYATVKRSVSLRIDGYTPYALILALKAEGAHNTSGPDLFVQVFQHNTLIVDSSHYGIKLTNLAGEQTSSTWQTRGFMVNPMDNSPMTIELHSGVENLWVDDISLEGFSHQRLEHACADCHSKTVISGSSYQHPYTTDLCEACHTTSSWLPYIRPMDHGQIIGSCAITGCHDGFGATGKSATHPPTTNDCEACHISIEWWYLLLPFNHSLVTTTQCAMSGCHGAEEKSTNHPQSDNACENCHTTTGWLDPVSP